MPLLMPLAVKPCGASVVVTMGTVFVTSKAPRRDAGPVASRAMSALGKRQRQNERSSSQPLKSRLKTVCTAGPPKYSGTLWFHAHVTLLTTPESAPSR